MNMDASEKRERLAEGSTGSCERKRHGTFRRDVYVAELFCDMAIYVPKT